MSTREDQRSYIGGGDIASIIGVGYRTPLYVWARKTGREPDMETSVKMQMGLLLEDFILADFAKTYNVDVVYQQKFFRMDDYCGGHIDGLCEFENVRTVVDAKFDTTSYGFEMLPVKHQAQAQWYMYVTGSQRAMFHVLHAMSGKFATYTIDRDEETIDWLRKEAASLWLHVQIDSPPEPNFANGDTAKEWYLWVKPEPKSQVIVDDLIVEDLQELARVSMRRLEFEKREDNIKERVKVAFNNADEMFGPDGVLVARSGRDKKTGSVNRIKNIIGGES